MARKKLYPVHLEGELATEEETNNINHISNLIRKDAMDAAARMAEAAQNVKLKVPDLLNNKVCYKCGNEGPAYCEICYMDLIAQNAKLQAGLDESIPIKDVQWFTNDLRNILVKRESVSYTPTDKLKDIMELYLKHIVKLGGIEHVSND